MEFLPVEIGFCPSKKAFKDYMKSIGRKDKFPPKAKASFNHFSEPDVGLIMIDPMIDRSKEVEPTQVVGLIVHECVHAFQWICDVIGEENPSAEFEAYTIQAISQATIAIYSRLRYGKKVKKRHHQAAA